MTEERLVVEQIKQLRMAYDQIPDLVIRDLETFINPNELTFVKDDPQGRESAYNEGLRAVWLHIQRRRALRVEGETDG